MPTFIGLSTMRCDNIDDEFKNIDFRYHDYVEFEITRSRISRSSLVRKHQ